MAFTQWLGNTIDTIGTALGAKERGWSEGVAGGGTTYTGLTQQSQAAGFTPASNANYGLNPYAGQYKSTGGDVKGDKVSANPKPTTTNPVNNGSKGITESQALGLGFDWNNLPGGYSRIEGGSGGNGGGGQDWDAIFNPAYESLKNYGNFLQQSKGEKLAGTEADYGRYTGQVAEEQKGLEASLAEQGRQLWESGRSAAGEALRAYNALAQQNASRYGLGTGAGSFISDLLGQEFMRAKASANETAQQGQNTLAIEGTKVKQFISGKMDELTKWKREADQSINDYFTKSMADIENQRGVLDQQKAAQKEAAVQNAINYKQQVEESDRTFKSQLATAAMQTIQNNTGKVYTPAQIAKVVNSFMQTGEFNPDSGDDNGQVSNIGFNQNYTYDEQGRLIDKTTGLPVA